MRSTGYLSLSNLRDALALGLLVTAMALPRLQLTGHASLLFVGTSFLGMTLMAGAATAWGSAAGMRGCWPGLRRSLWGALAGLVTGLVLAVIFVKVDLPLRHALSGDVHASAMAMAFPPDAPSRWAALLWVAGLETLFFQAAPTSFFARLTGVRGVSVAASALLRGFVAFEQARGLHIDPATMVAGHLGLAAVGSALFAWGGFPAAATFAAAVTSRLFW